MLSFWSGEQPCHKLPAHPVKRVCAGLYYYIFHTYSLFTSIYFFTLVITKNTTLKQTTSKEYIISVHDIWPELLLWIYCFVQRVMFGASCTAGSIWRNLTADGPLNLRSALHLWLIVQRNVISNSFWDKEIWKGKTRCNTTI